jgi:DNA repair exonuclease SbcCD ATPase subunit
VTTVETKLDEILARMARFEAGQQRLEAGYKLLEAGQQRLEAGYTQLDARYKQLDAGQQRLETGQQQMWAALNAHARRTSERFDEIEGTMTRGFARVQGQIQELMTRVEHQDERSDRLARRITELEGPKPPEH